MRALCGLVAACVVLSMGCEEEIEPLCVPGETRRCECGDGRTGAQWCNADGDAWACCHCDGSVDDDDDSSATDDDDDTAGDDDDSFPDWPSSLQISMTLWAEGGTGGGWADVALDMVLGDPHGQPLCTAQFEFDATYSYGLDQGPNQWTYSDEIVVWSGGGEVANDCPAEWELHQGDPVEDYRWGYHPMAFVSCDLVAATPALSNTFVAEDAAIFVDAGDGTFGDLCSIAGPQVQGMFGTGSVEALWLIPGTEGQMDGLGSFGYFAPPETTRVEVYLLMGFLMAAPSNTDEPVEGLEGDYLALPLWIWVME